MNLDPSDAANLYPTCVCRFLDKAAIITGEDKVNPEGSAANPWNLCSMQQVEEAKCVLRVIPVSLTSILYHIGVQQQYLVFQALQSDRHLGNTAFQIPAASYVVFAMLAITLWVPAYDRFVVPFMRRVRKGEGITVLQRIGIGLFLTIIESLVGAYVEERRRALALRHGTVVSPMSAMWLVPQLLVGGFAEAFNAIAMLEFYYKQFPENMRSIAGAFYFCGGALSNYAYSFLISTVHGMTAKDSTGNWLPEDLNHGRLDYFYYLVAVLCTLNFCYFLVCASWYRYKGAGDHIQTTISVEMEANKLDHHSA